MNLLMYGAGSIGRGFIGPLFAQAGYEAVFVDVDRRIIGALNSRRAYRYTVVTREKSYDIEVFGVRGVDGTDEAAVIDEIASCDIMATSLGASALQKVAPVIARGFSQRMQKSGQPLNLLICENLKDSAHTLRGWLERALPEDGRALLKEKCGLVEAAIGRMVPAAPENAGDPLHITVEEYGFLPVDKDAFVCNPPDIPMLVPYSPFSFYEERKLYLHNMGHAVCAYLGMLCGFETIAEAIANSAVRLLTQSAMTESAAMLSVKYKIPFPQIFDHAEDLLMRFGNAALGDTCERVGRDPMRKIAAGDRLAGALCQCAAHGIRPVYIALGYAAALRNLTGDAVRAGEIARDTGKLGEGQAKLAAELFMLLDSPMPGILEQAERIKKKLRGDIV